LGRTATTIPVDGPAGHELQVDTGWVGWLTLSQIPRTRRRFRAWIFTAVRSRYRFVYPTFEEKTARAIEACEAAWQFLLAPSGNPSRVARMYGSHISIATALMAARCASVNEV